MSENFTIEIWRAANLASPPELLRSHTVTTEENAETMVESLSEFFSSREGVEWDTDEVDDKGFLHGHCGEAIYVIQVKPPLMVSQS